VDTSPGPGDTAQAVIVSRWKTTIAAARTRIEAGLLTRPRAITAFA
jgi:hypothetical protein